ncbi:pentapeptide repeat-containing protein [Butyricicoccus faecihominis]|uniref:pentapeptide repeat-containing protein n=1 Tax=Butyricicoccus faecihominis TaxID=1712515 RepID=UPI00247ACCFE|nr:pentapeptide repeat-containing protein [Butyricicoccus faecihominis]MCQ5129533.1 pentapeptide repeat-containing protein [Butyricicoccus faecihominis]
MTARLPARLEPAPDAPALLAAAEAEERTAEGLYIRDIDLSGTRLFGLRLRGVLFENCRLSGCCWQRADCVDVVFRHCDLSNSDWRDGYFERTAFESCKAVGAAFPETGWRDAIWQGSAMGYASFDRASLRETAFADCDLSSAILADCAWKRLAFANCRMENVSFLHTALGGLDLTSCNIGGLTVSESSVELRGAIVSPEQAVGLAKRLGVVVKE